jgi:glycosyltransferase involved in cell wall biosynthesis
MRVLLLGDDLGRGGRERQLSLLATELPAEWDARVWSMGGGPFEQYLRERSVSVSVRSRRSRFDPSPAARLTIDMRRWRPDVVHSWGWMSALAAGPACRFLGVPHVDGMIRSGALEPDFTGLKRLGMSCSTLVVANSQAGLRAWSVDATKGRVVYNGFDRSRLPSTLGRSSDSSTEFTVVMTGRMEPVKHFDLVIAAARLLLQSSRGWRFVLVGDGSDRERLMRSAADLVHSGVVQFPQPPDEPLELVQDADVGVLMTNPRYRDEGLSNSIMEYMALGLPVVCGAGGGNSELVIEGVTGFIVPPADAVGLADRLAFLRANARVGQAMGDVGRARIAQEFSVDTMVRRMLHVYDEAMAAPPVSVRKRAAIRLTLRKNWTDGSRENAVHGRDSAAG